MVKNKYINLDIEENYNKYEDNIYLVAKTYRVLLF